MYEPVHIGIKIFPRCFKSEIMTQIKENRQQCIDILTSDYINNATLEFLETLTIDDLQQLVRDELNNNR